MSVMTPYRSGLSSGRDGFGQLLHAEWTKFRTVRGWIIGLVIGVIAMAGLGLLTAGGAQSSCQAQGGPARSGAACMPSFPLGPAGEPVNDSFYFVHQPLTGDGTITVRVTSMTGLLPPANAQLGRWPGSTGDTRPGLYPWAKAGIIIKENLNQGSAYAAMMVAADNGVRMQWNYTGDTPGLPGAVSPANPRWLRLTRSGDVITGYDSADGTHWTQVGAVTLSGLPSRRASRAVRRVPPVHREGPGLRGNQHDRPRTHPGHRRVRPRQRRWRHMDRRGRRAARGLSGIRELSPGWRPVHGDGNR